MAIVIRKKVSLEFLGDEYKEAYLIFKSIPLVDLDKVIAQINEAKENSEANKAVLGVLKSYFLEGKFPNMDKVLADDLDGLDAETAINCFQIFTGQEITKEQGTEVAEVADLKGESATPSSTEAKNPKN